MKEIPRERCYEGRNVIITGATGSLGRELAIYFASAGANVVAAVRNVKKGEALAAEIKKEFPDVRITAERLELSSFDSVDEFAARAAAFPPDLLINAAGIYHLPFSLSADGLEQHFAVNFACPLRLTLALLPLLNSRGGRVVTVTSVAAEHSRTDLSDIESRRVKNRTAVYGRTKRLVTLAFSELAVKAGALYPNVSFALCQPGICATSLFSPEKGGFNRAFSVFIVPLMKLIFPSPHNAARSTVSAALAGAVPNNSVCGPRGLFRVWGRPVFSPLKNDEMAGEKRTAAVRTALNAISAKRCLPNAEVFGEEFDNISGGKNETSIVL